MKLSKKLSLLVLIITCVGQQPMQAGMLARIKTVCECKKIHKMRQTATFMTMISGIVSLYGFMMLMVSASKSKPNEFYNGLSYNFLKNLHSLNFPGVHLLEDGNVEFTVTTLKTFLGYALGAFLAAAIIEPSNNYIDKTDTTLEVTAI